MSEFEHHLWNPSVPDRGATLRKPARPSVPGFRGFEHLSFAVADIEETTSFLEHVLGCERFYDMGPIDDPHGSGFGAYANVDVRVKVSKVRLFRSPFLNFEVIEPRFPGQNRAWPGLLDPGGWQLAWAVDDIDEALEGLRRADVHLLGGKRAEEEGHRGDGSQWRVSCLTSFGLHFDLVQGSPSATVGGSPGWHPSRPER